MEKRKVTVRMDGRTYSFYTDDPEEYIDKLEQRANQVLKQVYGSSGNAVLYLTDALMREKEKEAAEQAEGQKPAKAAARKSRKTSGKGTEEENGQVSVWDLLGE